MNGVDGAEFTCVTGHRTGVELHDSNGKAYFVPLLDVYTVLKEYRYLEAKVQNYPGMTRLMPVIEE